MTEASSVVVLTGAGISADSGLATFRGPGGLWEGRRLDEVATPDAWRRDPELVWRFYQERRAMLGSVAPNAAHRALVRLERALLDAGHAFLLVTQNVDDLHERAGSRPLHVHGELLRLCCEACGTSHHDDEHFDPASFVACPSCAFPQLRPDVVWFGEVPHGLDEIAHELGSCSHFLAIGTSGVVHPAAGFLELARASGARTDVNSLDAPDNLDARDAFHPGRATEIVPRLVERLLGELGIAR